MDDRHHATAATMALSGALLLIGCTLLSVPINLFEGLLPTPFLPILLVFLYGLDRPSSMPVGMVFGAGLYLDLLMGGALGPWSVVLLLTYAAILWQRSYFAGRDIVVLTTGFAIVLVGVLIVYWGALSVIGGRVMPVWSLIWQAAVTLIVFPIALMGFRHFVAKQPMSLGA